MKAAVAAFAAGLLFAVGLGVSGMTDPSRITAFLDVAGSWDPTLAFVMAAALAVYAPMNRIVRARGTPLFAPSFPPLTKSKIDAPLVSGSVLFGVGWGLSGWCPGPAFTSAFVATPQLLLFVASMMLGFALHDLRLYKRHPSHDVSPALR